MKSRYKNIIQKNLAEILEYRAVLKHDLKRKISLEQAAADWLEKGYAEKLHSAR